MRRREPPYLGSTRTRARGAAVISGKRAIPTPAAASRMSSVATWQLTVTGTPAKLSYVGSDPIIRSPGDSSCARGHGAPRCISSWRPAHRRSHSSRGAEPVPRGAARSLSLPKSSVSKSVKLLEGGDPSRQLLFRQRCVHFFSDCSARASALFILAPMHNGRSERMKPEEPASSSLALGRTGESPGPGR
jgi:hypothetical protein